MTKKHIFSFLLALSFGSIVTAQDLSKFNLYRPTENAKEALGKVIKQAQKESKNVLVQIGGNWCIWCARFDDMVSKDQQLDSAMNANFKVYHLNYSKENKNNELLATYQFPQRFGFPVFLILNEKGELLHTQNSWYLEADKAYNKEKTMAFFNDWSKDALDPNNYKN
jgi:thioredoxin-related protein